ncbi:CG34284 [Drosophila busckii]|uniref:CG34284 n=1 Tax=Drosophila busckii TaxID=30019 RepID=A0A0M4EHV1_DROBS|nr:uncharacterized protein LOC108602656 [Drosophila busckii]ALC46058.1 CG34284 [Drosophila busckii]
MLTKVLVCVAVLACVSLHSQAQTVEEALLAGKKAEGTLQQALNKLPPNAEAHGYADDVMSSLKKMLKEDCEQNLRQNGQINTYYACVEKYLGLSMASASELLSGQWASSGASRPGLFC